MLPEDKRTQLDGIVQQMVTNQESDSNIQFVVSDFKKKYSVQREPLVEQKKEMPLTNAKTTGNLYQDTGAIGREVVKGAGKAFLRGAIGTTALIEDIGKKGMEFLGFDTTNTGIKSLRDAGVQETLKSKSRAEQVGTVLENVAEVGVGFVKTGAQQALKARKQAKGLQNVLDNITPTTSELTPTQYDDLLMKGKITPKTATKPAQYILSEGEKQVATKYQHLIKSKDPVENSVSIVNEISKKDTEVGNFLRQNNAIFNKGEVKNFVLKRMEDVTDISLPEARVNKLKNTLIDNFLKKLPKNDMENLWKGRKAFDRSIETVFNGSPALQAQVKREFRNAIQEYIAEKTPNGVYKTAMRDMTELFDLSDVVNTKATKERALTGIRLWIKNNPTKAKVLGWSLGTGAVGVVGTSVLK